MQVPVQFLRIPMTNLSIRLVKPEDIIYIEDIIGLTNVVHKVNQEVTNCETMLSADEIEEGIYALQKQQDDYSEGMFNITFLGDE